MKKTLIALSILLCMLLSGCPAVDKSEIVSTIDNIIGGGVETAEPEKTGTEEAGVLLYYSEKDELYWESLFTKEEYAQMKTDFANFVKTGGGVLCDWETFEKEAAEWDKIKPLNYEYTVVWPSEKPLYSDVIDWYNKVKYDWLKDPHPGVFVNNHVNPQVFVAGSISRVYEELGQDIKSHEIGLASAVWIKYNPIWHYPEAVIWFSLKEWDIKGNAAGPLSYLVEVIESDYVSFRVLPDEPIPDPVDWELTENQIDFARQLVQFGARGEVLARHLGTILKNKDQFVEVLTLVGGLSKSEIEDVLAEVIWQERPQGGYMD